MHRAQQTFEQVQTEDDADVCADVVKYFLSQLFTLCERLSCTPTSHPWQVKRLYIKGAQKARKEDRRDRPAITDIERRLSELRECLERSDEESFLDIAFGE